MSGSAITDKSIKGGSKGQIALGTIVGGTDGNIAGTTVAGSNLVDSYTKAATYDYLVTGRTTAATLKATSLYCAGTFTYKNHNWTTRSVTIGNGVYTILIADDTD